MSKERLIKLLRGFEFKCPKECLSVNYKNCNECKLEQFADYLLANGVIVPTYNIGQTVYAVTKGDDLWWKGTVASRCCEFNEMSYGIMFDDGDFAMFEEECVFPTREEAEANLKENKRL